MVLEIFGDAHKIISFSNYFYKNNGFGDVHWIVMHHESQMIFSYYFPILSKPHARENEGGVIKIQVGPR